MKPEEVQDLDDFVKFAGNCEFHGSMFYNCYHREHPKNWAQRTFRQCYLDYCPVLNK